MRTRFYFQELGLVVVILVIGALLSYFGGTAPARGPDGIIQVNKFMKPDNLILLAKNTSFTAIMAAGAALVIISGGIDLSVGSIYALAAMCGALVLQRYGPLGTRPDASVWVSVGLPIITCLAVGALCGLINGLLIVLLRVHPFIITLGSMAVFRGVAFVCPGWFAAEGDVAIGQSIGDFPEAFTDHFIRYEVGKGLYPVPMFIMVGVAVIGAFVLRKTVFGRRVFALGSNELAARYCGVPVGWTKVLIYTISGLTCGIAAMIMLGYYGSASSGTGIGYELHVIAAAVVGGASLSGGRGSVIGALLGAVILQLIQNAIVILNINQNYSQIIIGVVIVIAVILDRANTALLRRTGRTKVQGASG